jgi:hypothetical protein
VKDLTTRTYQLVLPAADGEGQNARSVMVLEPKPVFRSVTIQSALFVAGGGNYLRVAATGLPTPYAVVSVDESGVTGASAGVKNAILVMPDIPVPMLVPPFTKLYAAARNGGALPGDVMYLSISTTPIPEEATIVQLAKAITTAFREAVPGMISEILGAVRERK